MRRYFRTTKTQTTAVTPCVYNYHHGHLIFSVLRSHRRVQFIFVFWKYALGERGRVILGMLGILCLDMIRYDMTYMQRIQRIQQGSTLTGCLSTGGTMRRRI
jgi:hypothetical protein